MSKILSLKGLLKEIDICRKLDKRIVFTNGCFDILHVGHVRYLAAAKAKGDILVVGLNSDQSIKSIKGEKRPLVCEAHRAEVIAGLECVDYVLVFYEPDPFNIIQAIMPDLLVKGGDWSEKTIIGADIVKADGGKVVTIPFVAGFSTSMIIQKIINRYG